MTTEAKSNPKTRRIEPETAQARLEAMQALAASHGGACLAVAYPGAHTPVAFNCPAHGDFTLRYGRLMAGQWCAQCGRESMRREMERHVLEYVTQRGGSLKSPYRSARTHVTVECPLHGEWQTSPDNLLRVPTWCPKCGIAQAGIARSKRAAERRAAKLASAPPEPPKPPKVKQSRVAPEFAATRLQTLRGIAAGHGGECLALQYVSTAVPMEFKCAAHGVFSRRASAILGGEWCGQCHRDKVRARVVNRLITYVALRGGTLKSEYAGRNAKVLVECPIHGDWAVNPQLMQSRKTWCPKCGTAAAMEKKRGRPGTRKVMPENASARIAAARTKAASHGGECLSEGNVRASTPLLFRCPLHGNFRMRYYNIIHGQWCPKCSLEQIRLKFEKKLRKLIAERGGTLKSAYTNAKEKVVVECPIHGTWRAVPSNLVTHGSWCPRCGAERGSINRKGKKRRKGGNVPILL